MKNPIHINQTTTAIETLRYEIVKFLEKEIIEVMKLIRDNVVDTEKVFKTIPLKDTIAELSRYGYTTHLRITPPTNSDVLSSMKNHTHILQVLYVEQFNKLDIDGKWKYLIECVIDNHSRTTNATELEILTGIDKNIFKNYTDPSNDITDIEQIIKHLLVFNFDVSIELEKDFDKSRTRGWKINLHQLLSSGDKCNQCLVCKCKTPTTTQPPPRDFSNVNIIAAEWKDGAWVGKYTYQTTEGNIGEGIATLNPFPHQDVKLDTF